MRLTIAFDDISLPLPPMQTPDIRQRVIEHVLELAARRGVDDVKLVVANSLHRRMTPAEIKRIVGERVFRSFWPESLTNFDAEDPDAGIQTIARQQGDSLIVTGEKHYTTNGTGWDGRGAHLFSVVCRTDPTKGASESLAVVMVPGNIPGVEVIGVYDKLGHRGVVTPRVDFNEVEVPAENLIGRPGQGNEIVSRAFSWTAGIIGAACVGVMRAAFDYAYDFAKRERRLGAMPVIDHQNVGFMLAEARMRIEAARYLTWKACHYSDTTGNRGEELAIMAKVYCSELCVQTIYDLMRVVGVESYTPHTPLERLLRDAMVFPLYDGGNMGVRRRQLHGILRREGYDQMLAAEGRVPPWTD
jgi:alkylation response protein AidB-like acyl-CoA dehydrogenase